MYLTLLSLTITFIRAILYVACNLTSAWRIFKNLNKSIMYSVMAFFDKNNAGRIINRV